MSILWGYAYIYLYRKSKRNLFFIVPFGESDEVFQASSVELVELSEPHLETTEMDAVVADLRADMPSQWVRFLANCALQGVPVFHSKQLSERLTGRVHIEHLSENQFGSLQIPRIYEAIKRVGDITAVLVLAPFILLLGVVIALCIKLDSPGPVFFVQKRMGYRGETFRMVKFRTMRVDQSGPHFTSPNDQRVTNVGAFLRRYRLDELPQAFNILRGEMSWIGPRPETVELAKWYEREVPFYTYRHIVRPGITGWAQVTQGQASGVDQIKEKLQYDFFYIKNFSQWLDLLIACKTVRILFTGYGAH